jgi:hypothetical protein
VFVCLIVCDVETSTMGGGGGLGPIFDVGRQEKKYEVVINSSCKGRYNTGPFVRTVLDNTFQYMCYRLRLSGTCIELAGEEALLYALKRNNFNRVAI